MPLPRRLLIDRSELGYYHLIARCVRQAFLCGGKHEHRREWIEDRARELAAIFAIDEDGAGGSPERLTTAAEPDTEPTLSADGTIVFVRGRR